MTATKITVRLLEKLRPSDRIHDTETPGLIAEAGRTGTVRFHYRRVMREGPKTGDARKQKAVSMALGAYPTMALDEARQEAARLGALLRSGVDPRERVEATSSEVCTVDDLIAEYMADADQAGRTTRTIEDIGMRYRRYLDVDITFDVTDVKTKIRRTKHQKAWGTVPVTQVSGEMARDRHRGIAENHGRVVANDTLRNFRAAFNWARKKRRHLHLGDNPVDAITFYRQRERTESLTLPDLGGWGRRLQALRNPLRREMHLLALYSGLRPTTLVQIERSWVSFKDRAILIPADAMKKRRAFDLPLSLPMIQIIERAMGFAQMLYPGAPWLFPTRSNKDGSGPVVPTASWHEKNLANETGYVLRHLYSNVAASTVVHVNGATAVVGKMHRMMLMGQKIAGLEGTYLNDRFLFSTLLEAQEAISSRITRLLSAEPSAAYLAEKEAQAQNRRTKRTKKRHQATRAARHKSLS